MQLKMVNETTDQILNTIQQHFVGDRTLLKKVLTAASRLGRTLMGCGQEALKTCRLIPYPKNRPG